ncbi:hypothetical protein K432DRAFT_67115 [Lepidopterella palustris CBS 459.81]|uniref:Uncharacterized protein n=1 Tax=Lepidopterella palustris CBS 459.81 TaxID=1314670 RepID=A0A8E2JJU7_9PEZI|nr:hypothetical protein K432DRAFT_67115 [Lepidopterella palustris CBS 459.81]
MLSMMAHSTPGIFGMARIRMTTSTANAQLLGSSASKKRQNPRPAKGPRSNTAVRLSCLWYNLQRSIHPERNVV